MAGGIARTWTSLAAADRVVRLAARTLALMCLLACLFTAAVASAQTAPGQQTDPGILDGSAQAKLDAARLQWRTAHIRSYRYVLDNGGGMAQPQQFLVVVRHGKPTRRSVLQAGSEATVAGLFDVIQSAIDQRATSLVVTYHRNGVPRSVAVEPESTIVESDGTVSQVADGQFGYGVSRFRRL